MTAVDLTSFDLEFHADSFYLRPWYVEDAEWYVRSRDDEVFQWTLESRDLTIEKAKSNIEKYRFIADGISRAIVGKDNHELLGSINLVFRDNNRRSAEIMFWLAPEGRGRRIATNAVNLLCKWAFDFLGLERVTLKAHDKNIRSQKVAKRAGFKRMLPTDTSESDANTFWFELNNKN